MNLSNRSLVLWADELFCRLAQFVTKQTNRNIYLSIFRVYIGLHVIKKFIFQWPYLRLLYGPGSFAIWTNEIWGIPADEVRAHYLFFCAVGLILGIAMVFGIGRRLTIFALFCDTEILQHLDGFCLDGGDNLLLFILLYLSLCDSFAYLTIDAFKTSHGNYLTRLLTNLGVICILTHLCLVYAVSGWSKVFAEQWRTGTAIYYLLNGERFCGTTYNHTLTSCVPFVYAATYGSMAWECLFPIVVFIRRLRTPFLLIGILMHIGIYIFMMINEFEILFIMTYGFFYADEDIRRFIAIIRQIKFINTPLVYFNKLLARSNEH